MAFLQEFSKIVILRDTPDVRFALGYPLEGTYYNNTNIGANTGNPFYKKLLDTTSAGYGWRSGYPNVDNILAAGDLYDGSNDGTFKALLRPNILNPIDTDQDNTTGYNLPPISSGTAIIVGDKLYIGSTSKKTYTGITTGGTEVTVTGTGFTGITTGSKIKLSSVTGITGLSTSTTYYAYAVGSTTLKLASSLANANNATAITSATGTFSGSAELTVAASGATYTQYTDFAIPSPALEVGDYIFWGDDPNGLKLGGKILNVYASGDTEYGLGARYQFEKNTTVAFPLHTSGTYSGDPIPQDIYYFRKSWVNKGIKNGFGDGFFVLIGMEQDQSGNYNIFPYLNCAGSPDPNNNSSNSITDTNSTFKTAYTDLIRIRRISNQFKSDETSEDVTEQIIPCSIHRTNGFYYDNSNFDSNGNLTGLFGTNTQFSSNITPQWCAYYINPYGDNSQKLDKNTTYVVEVNERLPAAQLGDIPQMWDFVKGGGI